MKPSASLRIALLLTLSAVATGTLLASGPSRSLALPRAEVALPAADAIAEAVIQELSLEGDACAITASLVARGSIRAVQGDFAVALGACMNETDPSEAEGCLADAWAEFHQGLDAVLAQHRARLHACGLVGGGPYDPAIDPADFAATVDNPYFPLPRGAKWRYRKPTDAAFEEVVVEVMPDTKKVAGIECTVSRSTETVAGQVGEVTFDYYAQDVAGNVWYFGELTMDYVDGQLASIDGSWTAGEDGASPGILMPADPAAAASFRREFLLNVAEDLGTIQGRAGLVAVPFGSFEDTVKVIDFNPLEPWEIECKNYAPGVGLIQEEDLTTGEVLQLVEFSF